MSEPIYPSYKLSVGPGRVGLDKSSSFGIPPTEPVKHCCEMHLPTPQDNAACNRALFDEGMTKRRVREGQGFPDVWPHDAAGNKVQGEMHIRKGGIARTRDTNPARDHKTRIKINVFGADITED